MKVAVFKNFKGQASVEYLLVYAVVIALLLVYLAKGGFFYNTLNNTNIRATNKIPATAVRIFP